MKNFMYASLIVATIFTSCKKDDAGANPTKTEILTNGTWAITAIVSDEDGNGTYELDDFAFLPSCFKDNFYTFRTNLQLEMNEGVTKCDPNDPQTDVIAWSLTNNETNLVIDTDVYLITELTNSTLKLKEDLGGNASSVITFTKR